jgi:hypothetical protein
LRNRKSKEALAKTAFLFALALTKSGDAGGETACGVVDAVDACPVTAGSRPEYASSGSRVHDGITEHTGKVRALPYTPTPADGFVAIAKTGVPYADGPANKQPYLTARPPEENARRDPDQECPFA